MRQHLLMGLKDKERKPLLQTLFIDFFGDREYGMLEFAIAQGIDVDKFESYRSDAPPVYTAALRMKDPRLVSILLKGNPNLAVTMEGEEVPPLVELARFEGLDEIVALLEKRD